MVLTPCSITFGVCPVTPPVGLTHMVFDRTSGSGGKSLLPEYAPGFNIRNSDICLSIYSATFRSKVRLACPFFRALASSPSILAARNVSSYPWFVLLPAKPFQLKQIAQQHPETQSTASAIFPRRILRVLGCWAQSSLHFWKSVFLAATVLRILIPSPLEY